VHREHGEILWLFGRGLSIDCHLEWDVPKNWQQLPRDEKIRRIAAELRAAMDAPGVNTAPVRGFLQFLSDRTRDTWRHRFLTTNWDFLLQREINKFVPDVVPRWLRDSHVFHLNGTVEVRADNSRRSVFVLREDTARTPSLEFDTALANMAWGSIFAVVGMSFECEPDKALFNLLNKVRDRLPSGESDWVIVNPCQTDLDASRDLIKFKLPRASVTLVRDTLTSWQKKRFYGLKESGVFS